MTYEQIKAWLDANIDTNGVGAITGAVANEGLTMILDFAAKLSEQGEIPDYDFVMEYTPLNINQYVFHSGNVYKFVSPTADTGTEPGTDTDVWAPVSPLELIHPSGADYKLQYYSTEVESVAGVLDLRSVGRFNVFEVISAGNINQILVNAVENLRFTLLNKTGGDLVINSHATITLKSDTTITLAANGFLHFESIEGVCKIVNDELVNRVIADNKYLLLSNGARIGQQGTEPFLEQYNATDDVWERGSLVNLPTLIPALQNGSVKFGYLYNWFAVTNAAEITTGVDGWEVPSKADFDTLIATLGQPQAGNRVKEKGYQHWSIDNILAINDVNFNARGTGKRVATTGQFTSIKEYTDFWTTYNPDAGRAYAYSLSPQFNVFIISNALKEFGHALRLIRPATVAEQALADGTFCTPYTGNNGRQYKTVKIGTQVWTAENLAETLYRDGTPIPEIQDDTLWTTDTTGARCSYDNNSTNAFYNLLKNTTKALKTVNYTAPAADIGNGTATDGTDTTLQDTAKTWTIDEHIDTIVKITPVDGTAPYAGVVLSNTADTLTFDDTLEKTPVAGDTYRILNTLVIDETPTIVAFDILTNTNDCAAILPLSIDLNERDEITTYIEKGNGEGVVICARKTDRIFMQKCYSLEANQESITIRPHLWNGAHFDIVAEKAIQRTATWLWDNDVAIPTTMGDLQLTADITVDNKRRFRELIISSVKWLEYTSLFPKLYIVRAFMTIKKTGGGAEEAIIKVRHYDKSADTTTDSSRVASTRFGAGTGFEAVAISVPITLKRGDRIQIVGEAGSVNFLATPGSHAEIVLA